MVKFFGELLRSKNILVLQEAYAALVVAFKASIVKLSDETSVSKKPFATSAAADVKIVLFALECLVDLVNAKGSVLSIWALDPPIFLLLSSHGGCTSESFAKNHPQTYLAVLQRLVTHCTVHHHFLASSSLLTSGHNSHSGKFCQIFFYKIMFIA